MLKAAGFIFYSECLLSIRRSSEWLFPLSFFVIMICLFPLAFSPDPAILKNLFPGFIWMAALFATTLSMTAVFHADLEEGHLEQLLFSNVPLPMIITMKLLAQWLISFLPLILLVPILGMMFQLDTPIILVIMMSLLAGSPSLIFISCLGTALTLGLKQQGVILSLLVLPLLVPILIFGISAVKQAEAHFSNAGSMALLMAISLASILFLPPVIAVIIKAGLDD